MRNLKGCRNPLCLSRRKHSVCCQCTRPDVAYALSVTSRYHACAGEAHWGAVKSILKYLKRIKDMFLIYDGGEHILEGYSELASSRTMMMPNANRVLYSSLMVVS
ncbi:UNVERIFIED_CONTAM: Retrovirus-related Pol polyprotein from transposon TNT 1-94 [Sesamum radiatum]|uniref:Retrovirus-related Pol polyprotein from transposon TNT 1-94 n=1 Tax=Sesamum radiatum TaxID=300843 RepID=A0AAW2VRJ1_SESRA